MARVTIARPSGTITTFNAPGAPANSSFLISINNLDETLGGYADASGNVHNLLTVEGHAEPLDLPASFVGELRVR